MDAKITKYGYRHPETKEWLYWDYKYATKPSGERGCFIDDAGWVSLHDATLYYCKNDIENDFEDVRRKYPEHTEGFELVKVNITLEALDDFEKG
jgi:hypothetical protein